MLHWVVYFARAYARPIILLYCAHLPGSTSVPDDDVVIPPGQALLPHAGLVSLEFVVRDVLARCAVVLTSTGHIQHQSMSDCLAQSTDS